MAKKNPGAWKRLSGATAKKKPHLEWRVIAATPANLIEELQALTDAKWRVFAITSHDGMLIISAYLSAWTADGTSDDATEESPA